MNKPATPDQLRAGLIEACAAIESQARACFLIGRGKPGRDDEQTLHTAWINADHDGYMRWVSLKALAGMARFQQTFCSQCGTEQSPGDAGFSHCENHRRERRAHPRQFSASVPSEGFETAEAALLFATRFVWLRPELFGAYVDRLNRGLAVSWTHGYSTMSVRAVEKAAAAPAARPAASVVPGHRYTIGEKSSTPDTEGSAARAG